MTRFQGDTKNIRRIATKSQQEKFADDHVWPGPDLLHSVAKQAFSSRDIQRTFRPIYAIFAPAPKSDFPFFLIQQIVLLQHVR